MTTTPPNYVSPDLALYVERCKTNLCVMYDPWEIDESAWGIVEDTLFWYKWHGNFSDMRSCCSAYTQLRDKLMSERGQLEDITV